MNYKQYLVIAGLNSFMNDDPETKEQFKSKFDFKHLTTDMQTFIDSGSFDDDEITRKAMMGVAFEFLPEYVKK